MAGNDGDSVIAAAKDLSSLDNIYQRLSGFWSKANGFINTIAACEKDGANADTVKKRARAQRELAQLRELAKEEVNDCHNPWG